jgi:hypothetical protein
MHYSSHLTLLPSIIRLWMLSKSETRCFVRSIQDRKVCEVVFQNCLQECIQWCRAANYCRTSDNVRLNLANVRAKVILIGHWSDKKNCHIIHFFCCDKIRLQIHSINLHFAIKFTRHSSILLNVAPEWLYILVSWLIYILWRIYI